MKTTSISIYEDNDKLRDVLDMLISTTEGFRVTGKYASCRNVKAEIAETHPDVVIMDIDMPGCSGIDGVKLIKEIDVTVKVIMHTVFDDDEKLFACLSNGADGYLLKRDSSLHLIPAIRDVIEGGAPMSPGIARKVLTAFHKPKQSEAQYHITPREQQVLQLLSRGFSYRMIGIEVSISPETVKRHLKNIYQKLHVQCGPEAVAKAIREKII
jgi:DNA-binding NarL/FixJ family response regulator